MAPVGCSIWSAPKVGLGATVGVGEAVDEAVGLGEPPVGPVIGLGEAPAPGLQAATSVASPRMERPRARRAREFENVKVGMARWTPEVGR